MTVEQTARPETGSSPTIRDASRAAARLSKALELAVADCGLSLPQYRLIAFLSGGPERATELAEWLEVSPPSLTALVDGLVTKGLVTRVASEQDRRCVRHELTDKGAEALEAGDAAIAQRLRIFTDTLPADKARRAIQGLALLGEAMELTRASQQAAADVKNAKHKEVTATR